MRQAAAVKNFFNRFARGFDATYSGQKSPLLRFLDNKLRGSTFQRFDLTMELCIDVAGKTVLDVGCGSGRYCVELAKRGASRVVGVDLAENMLALARELAASEGVSGICEFLQGDFLTLDLNRPFHYCLAMGFFDYVAEAQEALRKMQQLTEETLIASFPTARLDRKILRKMRYLLINRCPVYFYDKAAVSQLMSQLGVSDYQLYITGNGSADIVAVIQQRNQKANHL